jgi:hypothetical protein
MGRMAKTKTAYTSGLLLAQLLYATRCTLAQTAPVRADNRAPENLPTDAKSLTEVNK